MSRAGLFAAIGSLEGTLGRVLRRYELDQVDRASAVSEAVLAQTVEVIKNAGPEGLDRDQLRSRVSAFISEQRESARAEIQRRRGNTEEAREISRLVVDVAGRPRSRPEAIGGGGR